MLSLGNHHISLNCNATILYISNPCCFRLYVCLWVANAILQSLQNLNSLHTAILPTADLPLFSHCSTCFKVSFLPSLELPSFSQKNASRTTVFTFSVLCEIRKSKQLQCMFASVYRKIKDKKSDSTTISDNKFNVKLTTLFRPLLFFFIILRHQHR